MAKEVPNSFNDSSALVKEKTSLAHAKEKIILHLTSFKEAIVQQDEACTHREFVEKELLRTSV